MGRIEKINVYKMTVNATPLFSKMDTFIKAMGLPEKIVVGLDKTYTVENTEDIIAILEENKNDDYIVLLHYNGLEMDLWYNKTIIPMTVDFRGSNVQIFYKKLVFDNSYTLTQFREQFPKSYSLSEGGLFDHVDSMFKTMTEQTGEKYKHYILERRSKTNIFATAMLEFTFEDEKLIYIIFANWD